MLIVYLHNIYCINNNKLHFNYIIFDDEGIFIIKKRKKQGNFPAFEMNIILLLDYIFLN